MKRLTQTIALAGITSSLLLGTLDSMAQEQQQRQRGQGGQGRGNFDPAQFQERMLEGYQEALAMSADEFKAVKPLIEDVRAKQTEAAAGRGGFGGFGRGRGQGGDQGQGGQGGGRGRGAGGTVSPEAEALTKAIESGSAADIKAKLEAYRAARIKKETALKEAREKLRKVLTAKQEAQLVLGVPAKEGTFPLPALLD
jgi:hypothetical protein